MKAWEVIFADQKGEPSTMTLRAEHCPSEEDAARAIRSHLFPVMDEPGPQRLPGPHHFPYRPLAERA